MPGSTESRVLKNGRGASSTGSLDSTEPRDEKKKNEPPLLKNRVARSFVRAYRATLAAIDRFSDRFVGRPAVFVPVSAPRSTTPKLSEARRSEPAAWAKRTVVPGQTPARAPAALTSVRSSVPPARPVARDAPLASPHRPGASRPVSAAAATRRVHVPPARSGAGSSRGLAAPQRPNPVKAYRTAQVAAAQSRESASRTQ